MSPKQPEFRTRQRHEIRFFVVFSELHAWWSQRDAIPDAHEKPSQKYLNSYLCSFLLAPCSTLPLSRQWCTSIRCICSVQACQLHACRKHLPRRAENPELDRADPISRTASLAVHYADEFPDVKKFGLRFRRILLPSLPGRQFNGARPLMQAAPAPTRGKMVNPESAMGDQDPSREARMAGNAARRGKRERNCRGKRSRVEQRLPVHRMRRMGRDTTIVVNLVSGHSSRYERLPPADGPRLQCTCLHGHQRMSMQQHSVTGNVLRKGQ